MARALADPWRVRVLAELSVRPLSPSQFVEKAGGDLPHVARCFRQLASWGYIEILEERPGRRRGAAIEHIYRAVRRAYFNPAVWKEVPRSNREAASRAAISSYFARIEEAIQAGTFDEEIDRHLSWTAVALDRPAWLSLVEQLDHILAWLSELEVESSRRLRGRDGTIPAIAGLSAFRAPQPASIVLKAAPPHQESAVASESPPFAISPKLTKALSNKWRCRILMELTNCPLSPSRFVEEVGGSMTNISRCFRELAGWGLIEVLEERKGGRRGGGVETIYRNAMRPYFDTPTWRTLPRLVREEMSQSFLNSYVDRVTEAVDAGTFDADIDRHFSWKPLALDRLAWVELAECLDDVLANLSSLQAESLRRIDDVDDLIPTIIGLASFRSPTRE